MSSVICKRSTIIRFNQNSNFWGMKEFLLVLGLGRYLIRQSYWSRTTRSTWLCSVCTRASLNSSGICCPLSIFTQTRELPKTNTAIGKRRIVGQRSQTAKEHVRLKETYFRERIRQNSKADWSLQTQMLYKTSKRLVAVSFRCDLIITETTLNYDILITVHTEFKNL